MNGRERDICSRVRLVREEIKWSQIDFAQALHITKPKLAAIEYGHTPVRFDVARAISKTFDISLRWLAAGTGEIHPCDNGALLWTAEDWGKMGRNPLLTALFDYKSQNFDPQPFTKQTTGPVPNDFDFRRAILNWTRWTLGRTDFKDCATARDFVEDCTRLIREQIQKHLASGAAFRVMRPESDISAEIAHLTNIHASVNNREVKAQWPILKKRLQTATAQKGGKTMLADFLGEKLASVSQWLTDSDNAREPGAETTLRMLQWVERQERK